MNTARIIIALLTTMATGALADYMLPPAEDRVLLLVDLPTARLDKRGLVLPHDSSTNQFAVDRFWMQDRIYSDGICTGIRDDNPRSAAARIEQVQTSIAKQTAGLLLVELVWPKGSTRWIVTYLKVFDPDTEFARYFPKQEFYDAIKLPEGFVATSPIDFRQKLEQMNEESWRKIEGRPQPAGGAYVSPAAGDPSAHP